MQTLDKKLKAAAYDPMIDQCIRLRQEIRRIRSQVFDAAMTTNDETTRKKLLDIASCEIILDR